MERPTGNRKQRRAAARQGGGSPAAVEALAAAMRLHQQGDLAGAERLYRQILAREPRHAPSLHLLGVLAHQTGRQDAALELIGKAIALDSRDAVFHSNLGLVLQQLGRFREAEASFRRGLDLTPTDPEIHCNLGLALQHQRRLEEAIASYRRALELAPNLVEAYNNLGIALKEQGKLADSIAAYQRALQLRPGHADTLSNLGLALQEQGRLDEAVASYRKALAHRPDHLAIRSNLLFTLNYGGKPAPDLLAEARRYGEIARKQAQRFSAYEAVPDPARLRVGLVSGDLCTHPVAYFLESVLAALDPERIELFAYPTQPRFDAMSERLRARCRAWRPIFGMGDAAAARLIHADGVHLLIDLAGHTAENRLPLFAWKPAPVQASWLGYFATTGLTEMDYLIADPIAAPPAEEANFTEAIWRLPDSYRCFTPPDLALEPGPPPCQSSDAVTFGCFNNLAKLEDGVLAAWARILQAVPQARLFLKARQLTGAEIRASLAQRFAAHGIAAGRLILEGHSPRAEMLAAYRQIDLALDPFPYPGGTVTLEALWMGVPVVTRRGESLLAHGGESIARNAGLADWIAPDDAAYVAIAVAAARDPARLVALRARLRPQLLASPLCDAARFARNLETALWGMWQNKRG